MRAHTHTHTHAHTHLLHLLLMSLSQGQRTMWTLYACFSPTSCFFASFTALTHRKYADKASRWTVRARFPVLSFRIKFYKVHILKVGNRFLFFLTQSKSCLSCPHWHTRAHTQADVTQLCYLNTIWLNTQKKQTAITGQHSFILFHFVYILQTLQYFLASNCVKSLYYYLIDIVFEFLLEHYTF